jgi:hypothetical protein
MTTMSTPVNAALDLIDVLSERGYEPQEDTAEHEHLRADLTFSGLGSVRVIIADDVTVLAFDRYMAEMWSAKFSDLAPLAAITATMDAAESAASART